MANAGLAKADSPSGIIISKRIGSPDDPSSIEVAGVFPRSLVGSPVLENVVKSELDCAREHSIGGTTSAAADYLGSTATPISVRTCTDGAIDGTTVAPSSPTILSSMDGASGSIVGADNTRTGSGVIFNGMSDSLAGADGVVILLFFDDREGPASDAAFF